jgi:hypothetical protein
MEALEARQEQLVFRFPEKICPVEVVTMIATAGSFDWFSKRA